MNFVLTCRLMTEDEIQTKLYIKGLINIIWYLPMIALFMFCMTLILTSKRTYRVRKDSGVITFTSDEF